MASVGREIGVLRLLASVYFGLEILHEGIVMSIAVHHILVATEQFGEVFIHVFPRSKFGIFQFRTVSSSCQRLLHLIRSDDWAGHRSASGACALPISHTRGNQ